MVGIVRDEVFGPVISFGLGGTMVEVMRDRAVALPPLNQFLVDRLIDRTRAAKLLKSMRGAPEVDRNALKDLLLRVSEIACELPAIVEMDINPVIANADEWQNKGVARSLMAALVEATRSRHYSRMVGTVLKENTRMLQFTRSLGFKAEANAEDFQLMDVSLEL